MEKKNIVITIARQYGSGGKTIGAMLAEELHIPYYDKDLMKLASEDSGINEALFAKADEKVKNNLLYKVAKKFIRESLSARKATILPPTTICSTIRQKSSADWRMKNPV